MQEYKRATANATGCGFDSYSEMKYLVFPPFSPLRSHRASVEAKHGVEFRHSTSPEFGVKWGAECLNTKFPLPALLHTE